MRGTGAIALLPAYSPLIAPDIIRLPIDFVIQNELWLYYHESQRHKPGIQAFAAEVVR
jgi:DNA-binding transcriptional LysR family regulator